LQNPYQLICCNSSTTTPPVQGYQIVDIGRKLKLRRWRWRWRGRRLSLVWSVGLIATSGILFARPTDSNRKKNSRQNRFDQTF